MQYHLELTQTIVVQLTGSNGCTLPIDYRFHVQDCITNWSDPIAHIGVRSLLESKSNLLLDDLQTLNTGSSCSGAARFGKQTLSLQYLTKLYCIEIGSDFINLFFISLTLKLYWFYTWDWDNYLQLPTTLQEQPDYLRWHKSFQFPYVYVTNITNTRDSLCWLLRGWQSWLLFMHSIHMVEQG